MPFKEGDTKPEGSGRQKGTPNKRSFNARKLAEEYGCDPIEFLIWVMTNDWKSLGYSSAYKTSVTTNEKKKKKVTKTPHVSLSMRKEAAIELAPYIHPKLKTDTELDDEAKKEAKVVHLAYKLEKQ